MTSEYAPEHVKSKLIYDLDSIYRIESVLNAISNTVTLKASQVGSWSTVKINCFVIDEGPYPTVSSAIAKTFKDWIVYHHDKRHANFMGSKSFHNEFPNLHEIYTPLKLWRKSTESLSFNIQTQETFNPKNVLIINFGPYRNLHYLFNGIDPINVFMISLGTKRVGLGKYKDCITNIYTDKNVPGNANIVRIWKFKPLSIKQIGGSKRKRFIVHA